jgi:cytochrome c oxidase subunit 2
MTRQQRDMTTFDHVPNQSGDSMTSISARHRRWALPVAAFAALAVLSSCATDAPQDTWQPAGENARKIDNLQRWPFGIAGVVLLIVTSVVGYCVFRFRDRGQPIPKQSHGKPALEIALTILPALILIGIGIPTVSTLFDLAKTSDTECVVNVTGQQWWWEYDYPAQDGCGGIKQPIVTSGQLVFPAGQKVLLRISSRDVIHSYWIPKLNGKRDAVPGRVQTLRLEADQPGIYAGQCTEFCGLSHAYMRMEAVALDEAGFSTWVDNQLAPYAAPAEGSPAAPGEALFITNCTQCHQVNGIVDSNGDPVIARPDKYVYAGAAPNLTNLMTRTTFAGAAFDLMTQSCKDRLWSTPSAQFTATYLEGVVPSCLDKVQLREWLRNAPAKKPMYADPTQLNQTDGKYRGMPNLGLTEDQIDKLVAYLIERK